MGKHKKVAIQDLTVSAEIFDVDWRLDNFACMYQKLELTQDPLLHNIPFPLIWESYWKARVREHN